LNASGTLILLFDFNTPVVRIRTEKHVWGFLHRMDIAVQNAAQVLQIVKMVAENQSLMVAFGLLNKLPGVLNLNRYGVPAKGRILYLEAKALICL
jgi:hypothetical protein